MFLVYLFISISLIFFGLSIFGLFRFPDVYTRLHCSDLSNTLGFLSFATAGVLYLLSFKNTLPLISHIIIIAVVILIIEPAIGHIISRTAYKNGIKPKEAVVDRLNNP